MTDTKPDTLSDPTGLEYMVNPVGAVLAECERVTGLLRTAREYDVEFVVNLKSYAEGVRKFVRDKKLGRDAELAAIEIVRRAERAVGIAIRRGQAAGEIETKSEAAARASEVRLGRGDGKAKKPRIVDYLSKHDASSSHVDVFDLTDGVSDEQFEAALAEAKAERSLARINVKRKIQGLAPKPPRPEHLRKMRHFDPNRIVEQTILDSGIDAELSGAIDYRALDRHRLEEWISSLSGAITSLTTLKRNLKKELNREQA